MALGPGQATRPSVWSCWVSGRETEGGGGRGGGGRGSGGGGEWGEGDITQTLLCRTHLFVCSNLSLSLSLSQAL